MKYLLGVTDEQYDAVVDNKFKQYVGSIIAATQNPETGLNPTFGQLQQGTLTPHVEMLRMLATQFSAATGLTVTDTGVVNDANPTSSDAILAQSQTLVSLAEQLNAGNADSLYQVAAMAQAIELGVTPDALPEEEKGIAELPDYDEVAKMVNGTLKQSPAGNITPSGVSRLLKRVGADTTLKNALRRGAQFAWIPHGDTCAFCIALASRGWQNISKKTLKNGHAEHIHANCDCEYAIRFDTNTNVEGYDPDALYEQYKDASSSGSPKDKINALRRMQYASDREQINAQKRAAYAKMQSRNDGPDL